MLLDRRQFLGLIGVLAALFGLLVLPFLAQRFLGAEAFKVVFGVIILYYLLGRKFRDI